MSDAFLDIRPDHLKIVLDILARHVPDREVWAFGSRATWKTKDYSDLDLAVIGDEPLSLKLSAALADDFAESDLPFKVDVVDWATTSESFREIIRRDRVVVREVGTTTWSEYKVEQIKADGANALATGPFGSAISSKHFRAHGVPVIRGSNLSSMVGTRLVEDDFVFVGPEKAAEFRRSIVRPGDIIFTCWGTVDQVGLIDHRTKYGQYVISNKQMKLTPNAAVADSLFLYYLFSSPLYQDRIRAQAIGSSVPGFNLGQLRNMELLLPPVFEQKAIASTLGALDDKIDLNRRMNETLEAMARALFKSWFVDFDPVRAKMEGRKPDGMDEETTGLFPSALGDDDLPVGWREGVLGQVAQERRDLTDPRTVGDDASYIGLEHMPRRSIALETWGAAEDVSSSKAHFARGDFLFGKLRPYFHKVGIAPVSGVCSTDIVVVRPRSALWGVLTLMILSSDDFVAYTDRTSSGTKMPRTNWKDMSRYPIVLPGEKVARAYEALVSPLTEKIVANIHQSRTLAALRDLLLPRLLSGQLRLKDAEKMVADAV